MRWATRVGQVARERSPEVSQVFFRSSEWENLDYAKEI